MVFEDNFFGLTVAVHFQKNDFFFIQSIVYNSMVVTKQICFLATALKSWVHISDNIAGVVADPKHCYGGYRYREHCTKKWSFPLKFSSVNVTKLTESADLVTFIEEILTGKLQFCGMEGEGDRFPCPVIIQMMFLH